MAEQQNLIDGLNSHAPHFIRMLGGRIVGIDLDAISCTFEFNISKDFCHSIDIVQGGFITAMLDAAMSHAIFAHDQSINAVSSLEIKTTYLEPTRAGLLRVEGRVIKASYKTAFFEGRILNADGLQTATASSVAKLGRAT
ncbi:MAG: PaaI family thioesterase [Halieaceae bacterium]|nr:PaaI family thioesterase [Halieaceae bacterium]